MLIDWELSKRMDQGLSARSEEKTVSLFTIYCYCPKSIFRPGNVSIHFCKVTYANYESTQYR